MTNELLDHLTCGCGLCSSNTWQTPLNQECGERLLEHSNFIESDRVLYPLTSVYTYTPLGHTVMVWSSCQGQDNEPPRLYVFYCSDGQVTGCKNMLAPIHNQQLFAPWRWKEGVKQTVCCVHLRKCQRFGWPCVLSIYFIFCVTRCFLLKFIFRTRFLASLHYTPP